jgi:hypothetical protein
MKPSREILSLSREELLVLAAQLELQVAQLTATLETLQVENAHSTEATCARRFLFNRQFYQGVKV